MNVLSFSKPKRELRGHGRRVTTAPTFALEAHRAWRVSRVVLTA